MFKKGKEIKNGAASFFKDTRISTVAAAWVFYFLLAVVPLAFLIITAFNLFGVDVSTEIVSFFPEEFKTMAFEVVSAAENVSKGVTFFFVLTVILSTTTLLNQMSKDGDYIFRKKGRYRRGVLRRLWAIFAMGVLFVLFLLCALIFAYGNRFFSTLSLTAVGKVSVLISVFTLVVLTGYAIIMVLNRFISPVKLTFNVNSLGSLSALSVIVVGTIGFMAYLRLYNSYNAFYGGLATFIIFILWVYILMFGLALGSVVSMRYYYASKKIVQENKTA